MTKSEAYNILALHLARFLNYTELERLVATKHVENLDVHGDSGAMYRVQVLFRHDDKFGEIEVTGSIFCVSNPTLTLTQVLSVSPPGNSRTYVSVLFALIGLPMAFIHSVCRSCH